MRKSLAAALYRNLLHIQIGWMCLKTVSGYFKSRGQLFFQWTIMFSPHFTYGCRAMKMWLILALILASTLAQMWRRWNGLAWTRWTVTGGLSWPRCTTLKCYVLISDGKRMWDSPDRSFFSFTAGNLTKSHFSHGPEDFKRCLSLQPKQLCLCESHKASEELILKKEQLKCRLAFKSSTLILAGIFWHKEHGVLVLCRVLT